MNFSENASEEADPLEDSPSTALEEEEEEAEAEVEEDHAIATTTTTDTPSQAPTARKPKNPNHRSTKFGGAKPHTVAERIQALALVEYGASAKDASRITGVSRRRIQDIQRQARARGYDPDVSQVIRMEYVQDKERPGRPKKLSAEQQAYVLERVLAVGKTANKGRDVAGDLAEEFGVSRKTVMSVVEGGRKRKVSRVSGLLAVCSFGGRKGALGGFLHM